MRQAGAWWLIRLSLESERSKGESRHIEEPELATGCPNIMEARLRSGVQSRRAMFMRPFIPTLQEGCLVKGTKSLGGCLSLESECSQWGVQWGLGTSVLPEGSDWSG